jgi:hypothetical protein
VLFVTIRLAEAMKWETLKARSMFTTRSLRLRWSRAMLPVFLIATVIGTIPHLDIERVCRGLSLENPKDEHAICVTSEQTALTALRQKWAQYPAGIRNECANVVRIAPESSYYELQICIESQTEGSSSVLTP